MGCSNSRSQTSPEDELAFKEREIGFSLFIAAQVHGVIKKYSSDTHISETQMTHILQKLGTSSEAVESLKSNFFRNPFFETPYKGYNREHLTVLGLVLSDGSAAAKTKELLAILDPQCFGLLSRETLERTLRIMTRMSVEYPISLIKLSAFPSFETYKQTLEEKAGPMVESILRHVFSAEEQAIAIDKFNTKPFVSFLSSADIRRSIVEFNGKVKKSKTMTQESVEERGFERKLSGKGSRKSSVKKLPEDHKASPETTVSRYERLSTGKKAVEDTPVELKKVDKHIKKKVIHDPELQAKMRKGNYPCLILRVQMQGGESILICTCGKSKSDPRCDGSHNGTKFSPIAFQAMKSDTYYFCRCKQSKKMPFCDGTHNSLEW